MEDKDMQTQRKRNTLNLGVFVLLMITISFLSVIAFPGSELDYIAFGITIILLLALMHQVFILKKVLK